MLAKLLRKPVRNTASLVIWFSLFIPLSLSHQGKLALDSDQNLDLDLDSEPEAEYDDDEFYEDDPEEDDEFPDQFQNSADDPEDQDLQDSEEISAEDLSEMVTNLEREAHEEEQRGLLPQIISFLKGALTPASFASSSQQASNQRSPVHNGGNKKTLKPKPVNNEQNDLPEDLSDKYFQDDTLVDDIAAGIEESLFLSGFEDSNPVNETMESRQFSVYLFQGQYLSEPRLNTFIDGAIRNLASEMKTAVMEPIYFRVLPKGRVIGRAKPIKRFPNRNRRRRRKPLRQGQRRRRRRRRRRPFRGRRQVEESRQRRRRRRRQKQKKPVKNNARRRRKQRKPKQGVGGGRVEGLSKVVRDGDAEMQLFGNHTLIRSHMNMGPIELIMQFRTRRGLRRTGATLPRIKIHTVTRVNMDGSEMMDFLLDRPHPEAIQVRGRLFPMAERLAQNIFSRLFTPTSFLVSRIREKAGLAFLSRPGGSGRHL